MNKRDALMQQIVVKLQYSKIQNVKCQLGSISLCIHVEMHIFWRFLKTGIIMPIRYTTFKNLDTSECGAARQSFHFQKFTWTVKMCFFCKCLPLASKSNRQKENFKQKLFKYIYINFFSPSPPRPRVLILFLYSITV